MKWRNSFFRISAIKALIRVRTSLAEVFAVDVRGGMVGVRFNHAEEIFREIAAILQPTLNGVADKQRSFWIGFAFFEKRFRDFD
ncbi:MAG: hypothetical protein KIT13_03695 [Burkholderiales bacterium]|nr:hypothetical protein [Burkholderiales bacterium]